MGIVAGEMDLGLVEFGGEGPGEVVFRGRARDVSFFPRRLTGWGEER